VRKGKAAVVKSAIITSWRSFLSDQTGATSIEYALIASGVSIVIIGTVLAIGTHVTSLYTSVNTALK
jgi:pilus assembly protein Flp/PilA